MLHTCQAQQSISVDFTWFQPLQLMGFGALHQPTLDSLVLLSISGSKCACFASLCLWPQGRYQSYKVIVIISTTLFWDVFPEPIDCFLAAVSMIFAQPMYSATVAGEQENGGCTD